MRYDATTGLWWKYTKPNLAGYTVSWTDGKPWLHNALPLDYLERMLWQNELFGDEVKLIGIWRPGQFDWSIVTTQPHVEGQKATLVELEQAFAESGFEILPGAAWIRGVAVRPQRWLRCMGHSSCQRAPYRIRPAAAL